MIFISNLFLNLLFYYFFILIISRYTKQNALQRPFIILAIFSLLSIYFLFYFNFYTVSFPAYYFDYRFDWEKINFFR